MKKAGIVQWLNDISIKRKLYFTVGIMGLLIITELLTLIFAINTLSSVRAYVQGEGLYSKAQKDAVYHLLKYGQNHNDADYWSFLAFMGVLHGDSKARIELYKNNVNKQVVRQGFIEGRNHPDDIEGMINLFTRFNKVSYINKAITLWNQADSMSAQLIPIANQIHSEVNSVRPSSSTIESLVFQIHPINHQLTILEDNFSYTLGEGSRWLENIIFTLLFFIAITVEATGLILGIFISYGMSRGTKEIISAANAVSAGSFDYKARVFSKDEIGQIAVAFNKMIDSVAQSNRAKKDAERKQIEFDVMRRADRKFRIALEAAPSALIMVEQTGEIVLVNKQTEHLFGYTRNELIGKNVDLLVPERYKQSFRSLMLNYFEDPEKRNSGEGPDLFALHKSGEELPVEIGLNPIKTEDHILVLSSIIDVSRRKKEEEELRVAKERAEQLSQARQEFLSVMSHEMRTPLNAVIGITHLLAEGNLTDEQKENVSILQFSSQNLLGLINNILDFSKIEAGKLEIESVEININSLARSLMDSFRHHAEEKQVELRLESDYKGEADLMGDPIRLTQVLTNLVHNAIKFTDHGSVTLSVKTKSVQPGIFDVLFEVTDTGMGIEKNRLVEIFDSYTQAKPSITRQFGGTGLGLTICKKIVELMGSSIKVESEIGRGSVFSFHLLMPVSQSEAKKGKNITDHKNFNLNAARILLVEDNIINQIIAKKFIHRWGAIVDTAENGLEAVKKINEKRYDVVLMDLQMPVMDGYKASRTIRSLGFTNEQLPVIALTANALDDVRTRVFESGMNGYLTKPIDPNELYKTITKYLRIAKVNSSDTEKPQPPLVEKFDIAFLMDSFDDKFRKEFLQLQKKEILDFIPNIKEQSRQRNISEIKRITHKITPSLKRLDKIILLNKLNDLKNLIEVNSPEKEISILLQQICDDCDGILQQVNTLQQKYASA